MHFSTLLFAALASVSLAAPLEPRASSWTLQAFTRTCTDTPNQCHYAYNINTNDNTQPTACSYDIVGTASTIAAQQSYTVNCGAFVVSSSWSGQFGPNNGFQTLALNRSGDAELRNGVAVSPDHTTNA
ncbi:MAG: hypothetical protein Q9187_001674 [Circinaria calcarea]